MSERDVSFEVLYAVRDLGLRAPAPGLSASVEAAFERELQAELDGPRARRPSRRRPTVGSIALVMSALIAIAVAVGAIALLQHHNRPSRPSTASANLLKARLAVVRRPQTAADVLPARLKLKHPGFTIIPSLTRLVASPPGARIFLVVSAPRTGSRVLWNPKLGDQVSIEVVTNSSSGAVETQPVPAADLNDSRWIEPGGDFETHPPGQTHRTRYRDLYAAGIVPDGVARVRWTFANASGKPGRVIDAQVRNNVAYTSLLPGTSQLLRATWYAPDGRVVPTSDRAYLDAIQSRDNAIRTGLLHVFARYSYRPPAALLADFAVFSVGGRVPVRTSTGLRISSPSIRSIPLPILEVADPRAPQQLDPDDIREITAPSGAQVWAIPGERGLCLAVSHRDRVGNHAGAINGGGETCGDFDEVKAMGLGATNGGADQPTITYRLLPRSRPTITVGTGRHRQTIRPPYGIYIAIRNANSH